MRNSAVTAQQIEQLDRRAIEELGIPSIVLMENAGRAVAECVLAMVRRQRIPKVTVVCGMGNNAGDGFVAARHLKQAGVQVKTFLVDNEENLKSDPKIFLSVLKKLEYPLKRFVENEAIFRRALRDSDVVVDAIFGIGLNRLIVEPYFDVIEEINAAKKPVVAVDIPSGLDATSGKIHGICVKAKKTVTFSLLKKGFYIGAGPEYSGEVVLRQIGIPKEFLKRSDKR